ncbi:MFS transporter [Micrococcoides hystricis]|uniref:MFS transporter n=1 Tax=Micrococcoides hystricis TaxID=1572761 RepID=A0ABV6PAE7_9MICC
MVPPQPRRKGIVLRTTTAHWFPVASALLLVGWGANQFASLLAFYQQQHGFSQLAVTSMLGIYVAGLIPALLLGGRLSDALGRKPATFAALAMTVVASGAMVFGPWAPTMLFVGRFLAGIATGVAMAAGSSWVKELSQPPWDERAGHNSGARRASLFTTAGFWLGPVVSGLLANYAPAPEILPYLFHIVLCLPLMLLLAKVPDVVASAPAATTPNIASHYAYPDGGRRFWRVVAPGAPWVFGSGTLGFAVVPALLTGLGDHVLLYSTAAVALTLGAGVAVQALARRVDSERSAAATLTAISTTVVGLLIALMTALTQFAWLGLLASTLLGAGYGLILVAGLSETQRLSSSRALGRNSGQFYVLAYAGFLAPTIWAFAAQWFEPLQLLLAVLGLGVVSLLTIAVNSQKFLPARALSSTGESA